MITTQHQNQIEIKSFDWIDDMGKVQIVDETFVSQDQEVNIYVGRKNSNIPKGQQETDRKRWKYESNIVTFTSKSEGLPYNGIVVRKGTNIYVFGNEIDGDLAALRKLIKNRQFYLSKSNPKRIDYISKQDLDGLFVFDYLHTEENQPSYKKNNENFRKIVENVLNSDVSSLSIKRVLTANDNTSLRIKHLNAELSEKYKNFSNTKPVVLGHGFFSNIFSMEDLGLKIATDQKFQGRYVRDTWLIEYSGGPNTECSTCPNYKYGDLIDYYWPALVGGILKYSNKNSVDYIGYSTGGGIGIKSYEKYYQGTSNTMGYYLNNQGVWTSFTLPANFVDHMALIAPIGAFNGTTRFVKMMDRRGTELLQALSNKNHYNRKNVVDEAKAICNWISDPDCEVIVRFLSDAENVSHNYFSDIVIDVQNKSNLNPKLSSINRLLIIYGSFPLVDGDGLVPDEDISYMYSNSLANKKYKAEISSIHAFMDTKGGTYNPLLSNFLNDRTYSDEEKLDYNIQED